MQKVLEYLGAHLAECPQHVLEDAHFQLAEGHAVTPPMTLTSDGGLYEAEWDESVGLKLLRKPHNAAGEAVEVRSGGVNGIQAQVGGKGPWMDVTFHGLSNGVLQWLLQTSEAGQEMCRSPDLDPSIADLCQPEVPFPAPTPDQIRATPDSRAPLPTRVEGPPSTTVTKPEREGEEEPKAKKPLSRWAIFGIVIGTLMVVVVLAGVLWWKLGSPKGVKKRRDRIDRVPIVSRGLPDVVAPPPPDFPASNLPRWEDGPFINL